MIPLSERKWIDIGGDLEASYDGFKYVDIRAKGNHAYRVFLSQPAMRMAMALFHESPVVPWTKEDNE